MPFSLKNQGSSGFMKRALGVGLVAHGLAGAALYEAPKVTDRVERYHERRRAIERHEAYQALRRQIVRDAMQEIREGRYRSGHFLIHANAIDLREAGFFPESTNVAEIEREYDRLLSCFRAAIQSKRGPLTHEDIVDALGQATEGYNYQGVHGTQLALLLAEKIGSCDQISQLIMSLLYDGRDVLGGRVQEVGMRVYPPGPNGSGHVAPVARLGAHEYNFTAGDVAYPYGVRIEVHHMPQLYTDRHQLSMGPISPNRIRARAWRESDEDLKGLVEERPAEGSASDGQSILNVQSFLVPSSDGQDVRPYPGRLPFFSRSIVHRSSPRSSRQGRGQGVDNPPHVNLDGALESQRWPDLPLLVRWLYGAQLPQQLFIGADAEQRWLHQQGNNLEVSAYQPLSEEETVLLSTLLEDFATYDTDYQALRAAGDATLPNELTNLVNASALYRLLAVQSRVMGRRQAEAVAYERLGNLRGRIENLLQQAIRNQAGGVESDLLFVLDYIDGIGPGLLPLLDMLDNETRFALMNTVMQRLAQRVPGARSERDRNYFYSRSRILAPFLLSGTAESRERVLDRWQAELRPIQLFYVLDELCQQTKVVDVRDMNIRRREMHGGHTTFRSLELIGQHPIARRFRILQAFSKIANLYRVSFSEANQDCSVLRHQLDAFAQNTGLSSDEARQVWIDVCMHYVSIYAGSLPTVLLSRDERLLLDMLADPALSDPDYRFAIMSALDRIRRRQQED